ncbi:putative calcium-binding protein [Xenococcus sp. PCC 7305]|uniref:putative calcium-binding protein n=1 Tax=Xenococcus sp. PCC 7305 TaxID=102125 RepID=UPI0002ABDB6B|nr:putative calcium-binding protein [Xenococcus sp. PCC 7305]ELS04118.1 putative calcium-binding protein [Xenococcus sp. PCC 7305]
MSSIVDYNDPLLSNINSQNGFKIEDFEGLKELKGTSGNDLIYATNDNELINGGDGFDYIDGQGGNDVISGGDEMDFILGGDGNDLISGGNGDDMIDGGAGHDIVYGGSGSDQLSGGAGDDVFVFEFFDDGVDTISDFKVGEDTIKIHGAGSDANVDYNQDTGSLSVNGEEIAKLDAGLDGWNDDSYEVF